MDTPLAVPDLAALVAENARLAALVADLQEKLAAALAEVERLRKQGRDGKPPFSRGERKAHPKKPGRKPGQGEFVHRAAPEYENCDVTDYEAPVHGTTCAECGGRLGESEYEEASTCHAPENPRPRVDRFRVGVGRCTCCQKVCRGTHPKLKPDQFGATAHRVGPSVYALAHWLHYGQGVPVRRLPALLRELLGLSLTQGAITQDALRQVGATRPAPAPAEGAAVAATAAVGPIGQIYLALRAEIARQPVVHTDDTGWRVSGAPAWLMVFSSLELVVYQIRDRHRKEEVREILAGFLGVMVCDRGSSYESLNLLSLRQQKCLSHLIRNIKAVLGYLPSEERALAERLLGCFREALVLWRSLRTDAAPAFVEQRRVLVAQVDELLAPETHWNPVLNTLLNGIGRQHDQGHLLRFLEDPRIEPTNNRAERDLRGAVIARKVSQCSRTGDGAEAHAAWSSLIATLRRRGLAPRGALLECMRTGTLPEWGLPAPSAAGLPTS